MDRSPEHPLKNWPLITILVLLFFLATLAAVWHVSRLQSQLIESTAINDARLLSDALTEFRTLYTSEVVETARQHGLEISHDYATKENAIPLPATLSMLLGEKLGEHNLGGKTALYSPYPFPWRQAQGGLRDQYREAAWQFLSENPGKPYYQFIEQDGHKRLRYATADVMRSACVTCHNSHPDTPKNDWKTGDLRGVLEVDLSLDKIIAQTQTDLKGTIAIFGAIALLGLIGIGSVISRLRRSSQELQQRVEERTAELASKAKELQEARDQLLQNEKMAAIGQLAAGVAHEINNPIGYINSNLGTLQRYTDDLIELVGCYQTMEKRVEKSHPEVVKQSRAFREKIDFAYIKEDLADLVRESQEGAERVRRIVQDLKEFSHVDEAEWQWADLHQGLESTLNIVHNELKYTADIHKTYGKLPPVECIASQINQVFMNLLVNAAHAIEKSGTITLRTGCDGNEVWLEVGDTGKGIPADKLSHIFEPFYTTKPVGVGTGLGLSLSYSIIKKHHGRIEVESDVGNGSRFTIHLPIKHPDKRVETDTIASLEGDKS